MTQSISQRAMVRETPRDPHDLNRLREEWRLRAEEWSLARALADELEEGRKVLLSELQLALAADTTQWKAEREARTCKQFRDYLRKLFDAKRRANDCWIAMQNADRAYWEQNNSEATQRSERRMSR